MLSTTPDDRPNETGAPPMVRRLGLGMLGVVLAGAGYLIAVRGEAIVVDLATLGGKIWCF